MHFTKIHFRLTAIVIRTSHKKFEKYTVSFMRYQSWALTVSQLAAWNETLNAR